MSRNKIKWEQICTAEAPSISEKATFLYCTVQSSEQNCSLDMFYFYLKYNGDNYFRTHSKDSIFAR